ncbi:MAG: hypothetical protein LH461_06770 [Spirochaetaceae bacterium]|nr:hypothetical protein [Spirochaetaceae bacterium]
MSGETGSYVELGAADREVGCSRRLGREYSMRTVLYGTTAGRRVLRLAFVVGSVGALALPASAAQALSSPGSRPATPRVAKSSAAKAGDQGGPAVLGSAVKYVRTADGTIRQVR